jgi:hypothetical protein
MLHFGARPRRRDEAKNITTGSIHWLTDRRGRPPPLRLYFATVVHLSQGTFPYPPRLQAAVVSEAMYMYVFCLVDADRLHSGWCSRHSHHEPCAAR